MSSAESRSSPLAPLLVDPACASLTVDQIVRERAAMHPRRIALVQGERRIDYGELMDRVDRLTHVLRGMGVNRHDRVGVLSENRLEYVEAVLAVGALGAIAACKNWRQSDTELAHCFQLTQPGVILASERHAGRLHAVEHDERSVVTFGAHYERLLERADATPTDSATQPEDGLIIIYTSGTTGHPKGALISHRAEIARALTGTVDGQLHPGRGTICWSPMYHTGAADHMLGILMQGDAVFVVDGYRPTEILEIMSREWLGNISLMPAALASLIEEARRTGLRPKGLVACGAMADLVGAQQIAEVTTLLNARFRNTFGSTETGLAPASRHQIPIGVVPERLSKLQSSYCRVRLVDEEDRDVPVGEPGEVLLRSPSLFSGYWGAAEVNAHEFRDGWFHMGDVMVRNADGTLDFVDRRKYLIKSGGENIYPAEIERVLLADSRIADAAVVRRPDAHWGEVPVAFVVAAASNLTAEDVVAICRGQIANYKLPKEVLFIDESDMPRSETGKAKRFELEKRLRNDAHADGTQPAT